MQLYYSPGACSIAAHIALEIAGAPFEAMCVKIADGEHRRAEYLALNPQGRVPLLVRNGLPVVELPAILICIANWYPAANLLSKDAHHLSNSLSIMSFLASNVHIGFAGVWRPERFVDDPLMHEPLKLGALARLKTHFEWVESRLPKHGWINGSHAGVADFMLLPFYRFGLRVGLPMQRYERYTALLMAAEQLSAVQRVLHREGIQSLCRVP
jgi:glutathione S-transferase